ncbi:MAG: hypothetical protein ACO3CU_03870, partial [Candidatus Nanopelagicales bacterium]
MHAPAGDAGRSRLPRRLSTALMALAVAAVAFASAPAHSAEQVTPAASEAGLFGSQDPTYDGVYRQSYALLKLEISRLCSTAFIISKNRMPWI